MSPERDMTRNSSSYKGFNRFVNTVFPIFGAMACVAAMPFWGVLHLTRDRSEAQGAMWFN